MKRWCALLFLAACKREEIVVPEMTSSVMPAIHGLEFFSNNGCAACHCNDANGGCNLGAPLIQGAPLALIDRNLRQATAFDGHPVKLPTASDEDLDHLAAFLGTLKGGVPIENQTPIGRGFELYLSGQCIQCHLMSAQGVNQGGLGAAIAGIDPDNIYFALSGGVQCHPLQNRAPTGPTCSITGSVAADNETVRLLTDSPPPDADNERFYLSYFLAFIAPPPTSGIVDPCDDVSGEICTVAGNGIGGYTGDGMASKETLLYYPQNLELTDWNKDGTLDLVIVDWNNHRVRIVYLDREIDGIFNRIETIAGDGKVTGVDALNHPTDIAFDGEGDLVIAGWHNQNIYRYRNGAPPGTQRDQAAGVCDLRCGADGNVSLGRTTPLGLPASIEIMPDGSYFVSENACGRIRRVKVKGDAEMVQPDNCIDPVRLFTNTEIDTVAGKRQLFGYGGDGGPARLAKFNPFTGPTITNFGIALEHRSDGGPPRRLYIADSGNNVIRYLDLTVDPPTIHLFAGKPGFAGYRDGLALQAELSFPIAVYAHTDGAVYVADHRNHAIRKIHNGMVTTVAGTGRAGFNGDNAPGRESMLSGPSGIAVHPDGRVFISDTTNNRIRVLRP